MGYHKKSSSKSSKPLYQLKQEGVRTIRNTTYTIATWLDFL
jgi:hypothetical protein